MHDTNVYHTTGARDLLLGSDRDLTAFTSHDQEILRQGEESVKLYPPLNPNYKLKRQKIQFSRSVRTK